MKKIIVFIFLMVISLNIPMVFASDAKSESEMKAGNSMISENMGDKLSEKEINQIEMRIEEIRDMDKSELTDEEKQELRKELKDIRDASKRPGVYISVGGLLLVLILFLLLR